MFTEGVREIFMEGADRYGWLDNRLKKGKMEIARKLLARGDSPNEVADVTDLPIDTVIEISNQKFPVGA